MPVDTPHPDYDKATPAWKMVRDVLGGQRAVHDAGVNYLPMLSEQKPAMYAAYKGRAQFVAITERTHESLVGFLFRKDPQYVFPTSLASFMNDCTLGGLTFYDWLKDTTRAVMGVGRRGTLIDWDGVTLRPFIAPYEAEQILNWKVERVGSTLALTKLVLTENSTQFYGQGEGDGPGDSFEHKTFPQWRVYDVIFDTEGQPFVRCQLWRKRLNASATKKGGSGTAKGALPGTGAAGDPWLLIDETYPARRGVPLARIPFVFHGPNNYLPAVDKIPMEAMGHVNLSHYRTSADLENGLHFTGLPTPWCKGFGDENDKMALGSTVAWSSDKDYAECGFLQVVGGFEGLTSSLASKESQMASLGARMFDKDNSRAPEAYDTVRIRQTGESVTLSNVSVATTQSSSRVLQWAAWWMSNAVAPEDLAKQSSVTMTTEFTQADIQPQELDSLKGAWQGKAISHRTMFYRLQRADFYAPDWSYEQELEAIQDDPLGALFDLMATGTGGAGGGGQGNGAASGGGTTGKGKTGGAQGAGGNKAGGGDTKKPPASHESGGASEN